MRLILHPKVYSDIDEIMERYERVAIASFNALAITRIRMVACSSGVHRDWPWSISPIPGSANNVCIPCRYSIAPRLHYSFLPADSSQPDLDGTLSSSLALPRRYP
jgi:hypothetical protein